MSKFELDYDLYQQAGFSAASSHLLMNFLEDNPQIHWIQPSEEIEGTVDLILDNQMLSTYRSCPAYFMEAYVDGWGGKGRIWFLDFGILFHKMMEIYYREFRKPGFKLEEWAIDQGAHEWYAAEMDFHAEHKEYKSIGGLLGFGALLIAYATNFSAENEHLRILGTEIGFGKKREVPLGSVFTEYNFRYLSLFLSGRLDALVDDGFSICPLDHKTAASFRKDPAARYIMDEGPTGYIYAVNKILPQVLRGLPEGAAKNMNKGCSKIIMNYVSKSIPKEGSRFKRLPIQKTEEQLESYRQRMLITGESIFRDLVRYVNEGTALRDTSKCTQWYNGDCTFLGPHRQGSFRDEKMMLRTFFKNGAIWDTECVGEG